MKSILSFSLNFVNFLNHNHDLPT
ncbi:hypothetical protein RDI58_001346 [Solanum bulbocastanum]|uniref:Uncharacterized protein n=1 Tax=Solanum bulbocastanum TaxID=147425 RepID=A0AAN8UDW3_SOLBU